MSGGAFDYIQYRIRDISDAIEKKIETNKRRPFNNPKDYWEEMCNKEWEENGGRHFSNETIKAFKDGVYYLRMAEIYAQRIDYLLSGDDGEESFHRRLKEDIRNYIAEQDSKAIDNKDDD